jgi:Holliday junction DNA helicase RuvA
MYNYISGKLAEITPVFAVLDCNGVGYEIEIPLSTHDKIRQLSDVKLLVHYYQNDDGIRLFGFFTQEEKDLFRLLISINRVGPKIGLSMLSALPVSTIVNAILADDHKLLARTPGLGAKTAQRLIIELKDKVGSLQTSVERLPQSVNSAITDEAEKALITLGYKQLDIRKTFKILLKDDADIDVQNLIKKTMKHLYKKG